MAALAADKELEAIDPGGIRRWLMKASTTIYKGALVCVDVTTGLVEPATYAANKVFVGIASEQVVSAASGSYWINLYTTGTFKLLASSLEQADVGKHLQVVDDQTVNDVAGATPVPMGNLIEYISATSGWVTIISCGSYASTAAS